MLDKPERLSLRTMVALTDILGCRMEELITPVAARASRTRKTASASGRDESGVGEAGAGEFRPMRARITPTS